MSRSWKKLSSPPPSYLLCWWLCFFLSPWNSIAQNSGTLDPSEVRALNSLFEKWNAQAVENLWNISGEPCSGSAINDTELWDPINNPSIKCECGYENNTCHITQIRIEALGKTGEIPEEITTFKYLNILYGIIFVCFLSYNIPGHACFI
ncbi:probable LRR receptor-like serine/threonine-protein kinase At1g56130 [Ziziphus jujuba]|uniref:Probable LRR receptor-like serine/threonine-protein kinase At1g56130 n=1 Tax=Ziziphus jujuba TaxID=326968 RepID=A0ABM4A4W3_ZIZJJ|nr:probable LRR receptor-like serine/threonine-protein kinase At1g56130 [Ziziphus jujuba]